MELLDGKALTPDLMVGNEYVMTVWLINSPMRVYRYYRPRVYQEEEKNLREHLQENSQGFPPPPAIPEVSSIFITPLLYDYWSNRILYIILFPYL